MTKRGTCGHVNRHNCRIWADDQPNALQEWERDSTKVNVWMGITKSKVPGPYMFAERTITESPYDVRFSCQCFVEFVRDSNLRSMGPCVSCWFSVEEFYTQH
ncbi:hypothetical protein C0J52_08258 [Blattella germanica]|nr:hypothetical protein C0J52_08258 [Blattella germanica]